MQITITAILIVLGIIAAVILDNKRKVNMGLTALLFAYIIYVFVLGNPSRNFFTLWPVNVFLTLLSLAMFYGFASENGTLKWLADQMTYRVRNVPWLICPAFFLFSLLLGAIGIVPGAAGAIVIGIFLPIALEINLHPMLIVMTSGCGVLGGTLLGTGSASSTVRSFMVDAGYSDVDAMMGNVSMNNLLACVVVFVLAYLLFRGFKVRGSVDFKKPAPATREQKITLGIIALVMLLFILPTALFRVTGIEAFQTFGRKINLIPVMFAGAFLCACFRVADTATVIKKRVGWGTFFMVGGMCALVSTASIVGIDQVIGAWVSENVPTLLIGPALLLIAAVLSLFTFIPALALAGDISPSYLYTCVALGALNAGSCPLSTGGASVLAVAPEEHRQMIWRWEWLMVVFTVGIMTVMALFPIFR